MDGGWQAGAWIGLRTASDRMHLSYRIQIGAGDWEPVDELVRIVHVPCGFGGTRPYFVCPGIVYGVACGRRIGKLHGAGRYFLCRHCYRLAYASQHETALDRTLRRANKIRRRLGGEAGMAARFPDRPKGMWRRTYKRLSWQVFEAEMAAEDEIEARLAGAAHRLAQMRATRKSRP